MERKDLEDLIRGSIKPVKKPAPQPGDPAIDALVKLAILAITAASMLVIVTRAV
ncbi:hypothetical protein [Telmatospirillum sp. J64-1]|uniref:hypothetical protein n=1 Tax=Telmatospirillum sp. J64-1 TaxID=2502183 RepID=UPI001C8F3A10|nr:hypothetical protein [Telmatospirillum sp. J64-1]